MHPTPANEPKPRVGAATSGLVPGHTVTTGVLSPQAKDEGGTAVGQRTATACRQPSALARPAQAMLERAARHTGAEVARTASARGHGSVELYAH